jgi:hypothetical protein
MRLAGIGLTAVLVVATLHCRPSPPAPDPATPAPVTIVPTAIAPVIEERSRPGDEPPEIQAGRLADAIAILKRVCPADPGDERPGAGTFRAAELEKLSELVSAACRGADAPCGELLREVADCGLPFEEDDGVTSLRAIYGLFLGPLRGRAHIAAATLGTSLLEREDGKVRDIAFRIAVGSGAARRGQEDAEGRRATTIPLRPRVGEPMWVVFEWMAPCNDIQMQVKGPDVHGRMDLAPTDPCPEPAVNPTELMPRAIRAVWAGRVDELTEAGLAVWMPGADRPLVAVTPRELTAPPKTDP